MYRNFHAEITLLQWSTNYKLQTIVFLFFVTLFCDPLKLCQSTRRGGVGGIPFNNSLHLAQGSRVRYVVI